MEVEALIFPDEGVRAEVEALAASFEPAWHTRLNQESDLPAWFLAREKGRLVGFLTIFAPTVETVEVSAFVEPAQRRRGIFSSLLARARMIWGPRRWLLVSERDGMGIAQRLGKLQFTEATLTLGAAQRPVFSGLPGDLTLVQAEASDVDGALDILDRANGDEPGSYREFLHQVVSDPARRLLVLKQDDRPVGVGGLLFDEESTWLFALAVDPEHQGKGWGRVLVLGLLDLGAGKAAEYAIDVDSTNARAEKLYRSVGFVDRKVTDYYEMPREAR